MSLARPDLAYDGQHFTNCSPSTDLVYRAINDAVRHQPSTRMAF